MKTFLSSTFVDLELHRRAIVNALERLGHHVGHMEVLCAQPIAPTSACFAEIDACDLFIGVYAHRYGFVPPGSSVSITEQEFDHALNRKKPIFCFLTDEKYAWPTKDIEKDPGCTKLAIFKQAIRERFVTDVFTTPDNLALKVTTAVWNYILATRSLPVHIMALVILAFIGGGVGGAIWSNFWHALGGSTEPHGLAAIIWPLVTNLPILLLFALFQKTRFARFKVDYFDASIFLVGLMAASWVFYDFPFSQTMGFRSTIEGFSWSFFQKESVLVLIWTGCLLLGAFLPSLILRISAGSFGAKKSIIVFIIQTLLVVVPTSLVVVVFVNIYPGGEFETARGILAGVFLRLGLALALTVPWTQWSNSLL